MDIGSQSLCQLICDKLVASGASKLCVLAIGFDSALVASLCACTKPDKSQNITFIVTDNTSDLDAIRRYLGGHSEFTDHASTNTKKQRLKNYQEGGIFLITVMKFVLDIVESLDNIDCRKINRVIVVNHYDIGEFHPLALALNILKRFSEVASSYEEHHVAVYRQRPLPVVRQRKLRQDDAESPPERLPILAYLPL